MQNITRATYLKSTCRGISVQERKEGLQNRTQYPQPRHSLTPLWPCAALPHLKFLPHLMHRLSVVFYPWRRRQDTTTPSPYQQGFLGCIYLVYTRRSIRQPRTMSMNDPKTGWRAPAACRISSLAGLHFDRLRAARFCILRASGASLVRAA
jgi:hypothetical protein